MVNWLQFSFQVLDLICCTYYLRIRILQQFINVIQGGSFFLHFEYKFLLNISKLLTILFQLSRLGFESPSQFTVFFDNADEFFQRNINWQFTVAFVFLVVSVEPGHKNNEHITKSWKEIGLNFNLSTVFVVSHRTKHTIGQLDAQILRRSKNTFHFCEDSCKLNRSTLTAGISYVDFKTILLLGFSSNSKPWNWHWKSKGTSHLQLTI